jgi:hypothetical protein
MGLKGTGWIAQESQRQEQRVAPTHHVVHKASGEQKQNDKAKRRFGVEGERDNVRKFESKSLTSYNRPYVSLLHRRSARLKLNDLGCTSQAPWSNSICFTFSPFDGARSQKEEGRIHLHYSLGYSRRFGHTAFLSAVWATHKLSFRTLSRSLRRLIRLHSCYTKISKLGAYC